MVLFSRIYSEHTHTLIQTTSASKSSSYFPRSCRVCAHATYRNATSRPTRPSACLSCTLPATAAASPLWRPNRTLKPPLPRLLHQRRRFFISSNFSENFTVSEVWPHDVEAGTGSQRFEIPPGNSVCPANAVRRNFIVLDCVNRPRAGYATSSRCRTRNQPQH